MARDKFNDSDQKRILEAIGLAEKDTSGEIRVHIESKCRKGNGYDRACHLFNQLNMHKTEARNGVLIYLALDDHKTAIIGDIGIDQKVPDDFWTTTLDEMTSKFKEGEIVDGIVAGVREAGEQLAHYFAYTHDDENELSDEISFGE